MSIAHSLVAWAQEQGAEVVPPKSEWEAARITVKDGVALIYRNAKGKLRTNPEANKLIACMEQKQPFPKHMRPKGMAPPPPADGSRSVGQILAVYDGSNGDITKALYAELQAIGPAGFIAMNLFRAQKCSARAKVYRGGGYKGMAYDRKNWSLGLLCEALERHGADLGIQWGWSRDPAAIGFENVLYVDLPTGQVSFHNDGRKTGPDYRMAWDGIKGAGTDRICRWVRDVLNGWKMVTLPVNPKVGDTVIVEGPAYVRR